MQKEIAKLEFGLDYHFKFLIVITLPFLLIISFWIKGHFKRPTLHIWVEPVFVRIEVNSGMVGFGVYVFEGDTFPLHPRNFTHSKAYSEFPSLIESLFGNWPYPKFKKLFSASGGDIFIPFYLIFIVLVIFSVYGLKQNDTSHPLRVVCQPPDKK